jgi:DNA-directed RNA polymerase specialized sigma24 family protein
MRTAIAVDSNDLYSNFVTFLRGSGRSREAATIVIQDFVSRAARRVIRRGLRIDRAEVCQEAMLALLANPHRFDAERGSVSSFLHQITLEAIRTVRATYMPPGNRKRQNAEPAAASVPIEELTMEETALFAQARDGSAAAIEARCDVRRLFERMPPLLAVVFPRLADGEPKSNLADDLGIDRFSLDRRLSRFRRDRQLAA